MKLNTATLPPQQPLPIIGEKLHQVFHSVLENLIKVMDGYCLEEPYFSNKVRALLSVFCPHMSLSLQTCMRAVPSEAQAVGGHPDEDVKGPLTAAVGTPGNHDECGRSDSS